jgi:class 3 adenylate cyclase/predicted ATPase
MWSAAMNVREWLRGLGLGQYEEKFRDNKIDVDVLADLSDGDLEKLDIPIGDRKRLLRAIADLGAGKPLATSARRVAAAPASAPQSFTQPDAAERRPITVMFCDLAGSTGLASRLDAEDWRNLVSAFLDEASNAVTGLGGHVLKKLGDGLMVLFGYPQAEENDAERAVRAALAIQRVLEELNARNAGAGVPPLVARIGLESGPVIVDAAGEPFGDAPNIAARVQAAAEPGTVLVTSTVQKQIAGLFVVEDRGAHELKGVPAPVTLYRILRFVEEVTRLLLERGEQGGAKAIPPTLRQSLAARLDRLGSAREVAQIGAVLGRSFSYALLRDVALQSAGGGRASTGPTGSTEDRELDEYSLQSALDRLIGADLLFVEGGPPEAIYRFKHALIQESAYDGLLKSRRFTLHRRAAQARGRARQSRDRVVEQGGRGRAAPLGLQGGDRSTRQGDRDGREGGASAGRGWRPRYCEPTSEVAHRLWSCSDVVERLAADEMGDAYMRASEFARPAEGAAPRFVAYYAQCLTGFMRGQNRQARETSETFLREAEAEGRATEAGVARRVLGFVLLKLGDLQAARSVRALGDYIRERDGETLFGFGNDTQISATNFLALTEWHLGELDRARELTERSTRLAAELGQVAAVASALYFTTVLESRRGDVSATRFGAESLLALTEEHNMKTYADVSHVYANWARGRQLDPEAGALGLKQALESYLALGNKSSAPSFYGLVAELEAMTPGSDSALAQIDRGLEIADETGEHFTDSYLHRLRGEILLQRDLANSAPAEEAFQTSIAVAKQQGARSYDLLAALSLAKIYRSTSRVAEACAILAPALDGFSPTPEMPEIDEAQGLLKVWTNGAEGRAAAQVRSMGS